MKALPLSIGVIHFVGIGGIGMSGIAELMHNLGYRVQGSDRAEGANTSRLRTLGVPISIGHGVSNLGAAQVVVISSAVKPDNVEVIEARKRLIPVVRRAEMLAELMRLKWSIAIAGTHGKTTTTSLIAAILCRAGLDPTVVNGGIINAWGSNARLGQGDWMVVEADESDGTLVKLPATIALVTNIDPEHLDHYKTFNALRTAFVNFVENIPFYGYAVVCIDHPEVQALIPQLIDRRVITYGFSLQADVRAIEVQANGEGSRFRAPVSDRKTGVEHTMTDLFLPMFGRHNVQNALAAIAVAKALDLGDDVIRSGLARFEGVKRRFTKTGEVDGITVIDDYGHHPVEIAAVLSAARSITAGKVIAVIQPHRYSRLYNLFGEFCSCFNDADAVIVADVYAAGEEAIDGISREALVEGLRNHGHRRALSMKDRDELPRLVADIARSGDLVVCLGAGTISQWAYALPEELRPSSPRGWKAMIAKAARPSSLIYRLPPVRGRYSENVPLASVTWFRVGGPAEVMFRPADLDDLAAFMATRPLDVPVMVMGVGSNILIRDGGVPGVVVRLGRAFAGIDVQGTLISAGAAALDVNVANVALDASLSGLEFLSGIPGTIGGALRMNAGAYGREMQDVTISVSLLDSRGAVRDLQPEQLHFGYRCCGVSDDSIFIAARMRGLPSDQATIRNRMEEIRRARASTQPIRSRTSGSTFANPPSLKAWQLIDRAGCRGLAIGGARVSEQHCNFIVNSGGATASDLEELGEEVRRRVLSCTGVMLEWEVKRVGIPVVDADPVLELS